MPAASDMAKQGSRTVLTGCSWAALYCIYHQHIAEPVLGMAPARDHGRSMSMARPILKLTTPDGTGEDSGSHCMSGQPGRIIRLITPYASAYALPSKTHMKATRRGISKDAQRCISEEAPRCISEEAPRCISEEAPRCISEEASRCISEETPRYIPKEAPRCIPKEAPRCIPKRLMRFIALFAYPYQSFDVYPSFCSE